MNFLRFLFFFICLAGLGLISFAVVLILPILSMIGTVALIILAAAFLAKMFAGKKSEEEAP